MLAQAHHRKPSRRDKRLTEYKTAMTGSADAASSYVGSSIGDDCGCRCGMVAGSGFGSAEFFAAQRFGAGTIHTEPN